MTEEHAGGRKNWAGTREIFVFLALSLCVLSSYTVSGLIGYHPKKGRYKTGSLQQGRELPTLISQSFSLLPRTYGDSVGSPRRGCSARCFRWTHPRVRSCLSYVAGKCFFGYSTFEALLQSFFLCKVRARLPLGNQCGCKPIPVHLCISSVK